MNSYVIYFEKREQYDCGANCKVRSEAKLFDETATLKEIIEWVKSQADYFVNDYNILTNPQIIGIHEKKGGDNV